MQNSYSNEPCAARQSTDPCAPKIEPFWSEWSSDGFCLVSCGMGVRPYRRFCSHGNKCPGQYFLIMLMINIKKHKDMPYL